MDARMNRRYAVLAGPSCIARSVAPTTRIAPLGASACFYKRRQLGILLRFIEEGWGEMDLTACVTSRSMILPERYDSGWGAIFRV